MLVSELKKHIREVPDYPKPGVTFYDLTTLFKNGDAFHTVIERLAERFRGDKIDRRRRRRGEGIHARRRLGPHLWIRHRARAQAGKLPWRITGEDYTLEYGHGRLEVHEDAVDRGQRVLIVDDVLATGGTAAATGRLMERLGATVCGYAFLLELVFLNGRSRLDSDNVFSLISYA
jgi:adenine phosphoribosyltransferase